MERSETPVTSGKTPAYDIQRYCQAPLGATDHRQAVERSETPVNEQVVERSETPVNEQVVERSETPANNKQ